jgi:hypothetical protein
MCELSTHKNVKLITWAKSNNFQDYPHSPKNLYHFDVTFATNHRISYIKGSGSSFQSLSLNVSCEFGLSMVCDLSLHHFGSNLHEPTFFLVCAS